MPSRAYTSLLLSVWQLNLLKRLGTCQCPLGLIPHCYAENFKKMVDNAELVSMPSRAYTSLLQGMFEFMGFREYCVNALSGLYLIVTIRKLLKSQFNSLCQCPLGLIPHCYEKGYSGTGRKVSWCQCPLGLIPHCYKSKS